MLGGQLYFAHILGHDGLPLGQRRFSALFGHELQILWLYVFFGLQFKILKEKEIYEVCYDCSVGYFGSNHFLFIILFEVTLFIEMSVFTLILILYFLFLFFFFRSPIELT